jgi:hypothetical protein
MGDSARDIVFTRHDGRRGLEWLRVSYRLFRRAPAPWLLLVVLYYFVLLAIRFVPFVGSLGLFVMKPVFAVGFLAAAWNQERGVTPSPRHLFQGFRANLWALVPLGIVMLVGISLAISATALIDGGRLIGLLVDPAPAEMDQDAIAKRLSDTTSDPRVQFGMLFGVLCAIPTILALWWAPALVVFQDVGMLTALRVSFKAAIANWRPLLRYVVLLFFFTAVAPSIFTMLLGIVLPQAAAPFVLAGVMLTYMWCFVAIMQISDYVSYRDVFHAGETLAPLNQAGRPTQSQRHGPGNGIGG